MPGVNMKRRFLLLSGGGVVLAASAAVLSGRFASVPAPAVAPWREAGRPEEMRRRILSYALLAPNPHNLQPWQADLREPGVITLRHDPARLLPETDPFSRQIMIGHGCFIELASIAARQFGQRLDVALFPEGEPTRASLDDRPIARLRLVDGARPDTLFQAILDRQSVKKPFDVARPVAPEAAGRIIAAAGEAGGAFRVESAPERVARHRDLLARAAELELRTPAKLKESLDLVRVGYSEIVANPDGIDLGGPFFETLNMLGLMSRASMLDTGSQAFRGQLDSYRALCQGTASVGWLVTPGNTRADQITAGRAWMRLTLAATQAGVSVHPMSQLLQEYREMADLQREALALIGEPNGHVQMLARLGYASPVDPSPRHKVERLIVG